MKITSFFTALLLSMTIFQSAMSQSTTTGIRHTVVFKLKHPAGSVEEKDFLAAAMVLASIPGVENFESMKQISKKNHFTFGFSMEFANQQMYDQYNSHPDHVAFVQERWMKEVEDFLEIDYEITK
jgi:hypothetical protein